MVKQNSNKKCEGYIDGAIYQTFDQYPHKFNFGQFI